jgi:hypothetical protein
MRSTRLSRRSHNPSRLSPSTASVNPPRRSRLGGACNQHADRMAPSRPCLLSERPWLPRPWPTLAVPSGLGVDRRHTTPARCRRPVSTETCGDAVDFRVAGVPKRVSSHTGGWRGLCRGLQRLPTQVGDFPPRARGARWAAQRPYVVRVVCAVFGPPRVLAEVVQGLRDGPGSPVSRLCGRVHEMGPRHGR